MSSGERGEVPGCLEAEELMAPGCEFMEGGCPSVCELAVLEMMLAICSVTFW